MMPRPVPYLRIRKLTRDIIQARCYASSTSKSPGGPKLLTQRMAGTIVRDITRLAFDMLDAASQTSSFENRVVLTGSSGCGKSFLLQQAADYCTSKDWIVLYVPRAVQLVNSTTTYTYDPRTRTYLQPTSSHRNLKRFLSVNTPPLGSLRTQEEVPLDNKNGPVPRGTSLAELINVGLKDQALAPTILSTLLEELGKQTQYPVLLAVDDFQALYCKTTYRDPHFVPIKSYHLSIPRLLLDYASGRKSFKKGAFLGAINASDPLFRTPPELRGALNLDDRPPDPYSKVSSTLKDYTRGLRPLAVPEKLTVDEAASLFEVWMKSNALHSTANDELFMSKYSESSGNARNFVWKGLLSTLET